MRGNTTAVLRRAQAGDDDARRHLDAYVYEELRRLAHVLVRFEREKDTLRPTGLVHDVMLCMRYDNINDGEHLHRLLLRMLRNRITDKLRRRWSRRRATEHYQPGERRHDPDVTIDVQNAVLKLVKRDPRACLVLLYRVDGYTIAETAARLEISTGTVENDWKRGRALFRRYLSDA